MKGASGSMRCPNAARRRARQAHVAPAAARPYLARMPTDTPMRAAIVPVTPLQQNCTLLWCTATMKGAFVDPGGDLHKLRAAAEHHGVTIEKIPLTTGHIDHCGAAGEFAKELGVKIEGPHEADRFWIARLEDDGRRYGVRGTPFDPARARGGAGHVTLG